MRVNFPPAIGGSGEHCSGRRRLPQLPDEIVVFFVGADPKPDDQIAMLLCDSAIVIPDSN